MSPEPATVVHLAARRVRLHGAGPERETTADHIDADGVRLRDPEAVPRARFVWLDLDLPGGEPVRALGEVLPRRDATSLALDIKFKHLFPDDRRRLLQALVATGG